jgi:hypothetical protein
MMGNMFSINALLLQFAASAMVGAAVAGDGRSLLARVLVGAAVVVCTGALRVAVAAATGAGADGGHITQLLAANMGMAEHDFHTKLYACAPEFLPMTEEYGDLSRTLLLPVAVLVAARVLYLVGADGVAGEKAERRAKPEHVYMVLQTAWFTLMAGLFMRLKLFWVSAVIAVASVVASKEFVCGGLVGRSEEKAVPHGALLVALLAASALVGWGNFYQGFVFEDQWEGGTMVDLVEWAQASTAPDEAFAGPMPITSLVWGSANRPIVNHPHYETTQMRDITVQVYSTHSRLEDKDVWELFRNLSTT